MPLDSAREEIGTSSKDPDATRQGGDQVVDLARTSIDLRQLETFVVRPRICTKVWLTLPWRLLPQHGCVGCASAASVLSVDFRCSGGSYVAALLDNQQASCLRVESDLEV